MQIQNKSIGFYGVTPFSERTHYVDAQKSRIASLALKALSIFALAATGAGIGFSVGGVFGAVAGISLVALSILLYQSH